MSKPRPDNREQLCTEITEICDMILEIDPDIWRDMVGAQIYLITTYDWLLTVKQTAEHEFEKGLL